MEKAGKSGSVCEAALSSKYAHTHRHDWGKKKEEVKEKGITCKLCGV